MRKIISKIAGTLLGFSLALAVGTIFSKKAETIKAEGNYESAYVLDGTVVQTDNDDKDASGYAKSLTVTQSSVSWEVYGNTTMNPWRIGGKSLTEVDRTVYSTSAISDDIAKIEVTHGTASNITVNSWTVIVSTASNGGGTVISTLTPTFAANTKTTVERPTGVSWAGRYFKFVYNVSVSGNSNRYVQFTKAEFFKESVKQDTSISITNENPLLLTAGTASTPLSVQTSPSGLSLTYESSNSSVVTVDSSGNVTPVANGTATITASYAGNDSYKASSASIDVTVLKAVSSLPSNGSISITPTDLDKIGAGSGYVDYDGYHYSLVTDSEAELIWVSKNAMVQSSLIQMQKDTSEIYNYTPIDNLKSVVVDNSEGTYTLKYGETIDNITLDSVTSNSKFFSIKATATLKISSISVTFGEDAPVLTYSVSYDGNGGVGSMTDSNSPYEAGSSVTVLENTFIKDGYTFIGWKDQDGNDVSGSFTIAKDTTLYAQWEENEIPLVGNWVLAELSEISSTDKVVVVGDNGSTYALDNDNGASSAPSALAVTISENKITSTVTKDMQWTVSGNSTDGYTFYPNGDTSSWLYVYNNNNGVRVGTGDDKTFSISEEGYLFNVGQSRYVGIYNSADWRSYTSINNNIKDQAFSFYKFVESSGETDADVVNGFVNDYLKWNTYEPTHTEGVDGAHECLGENGYYIQAKHAFQDLTSNQKDLFRHRGDYASSEDTYAAPRARYEAWARAYGDATPYEETVTPVLGAGHLAFNSANNNSSTVLIIVVAVTSISSIGLLLVIKRKRALTK